MYNLSKPLRISLSVAIILSLIGCASTPGLQFGSHSCSSLEPWMESVKALGEGTNLNSLNTPQLATLLSPAFKDEIFEPIFDKPYSQLDINKYNGISISLKECNGKPSDTWARSYLAAAFNPSSREYGIWQPYISKANTVSYESALAHRQAEAAKKALAYNQRIEQVRQSDLRRQARLEYQKEKRDADDSGDRLLNALKGFVATGTALQLHNELTNANLHQYDEYGSCAPELAKRLVTCKSHTVFDSCNGGCDFETKCENSSAPRWSIRSCESVYYNLNHPTYYCDVDDTFNKRSRDKVIAKICGN